jgi:hypothetical protein
LFPRLHARREELLILAAQRKPHQELEQATQENIKHFQEIQIGLESFVASQVEAEMFLPSNYCGFVPTWDWWVKMGCARTRGQTFDNGTVVQAKI